MKITANGITMNYTLDGPASAPVVTLEPFAGGRRVDVGSRRCPRSRRDIASFATTRAATEAPMPRRRPTRSGNWRRTPARS